MLWACAGTSPNGGPFLTERVPFRADNAALARSAEDFGVIWTSMAYFYPHGGGDRSIRLSVSYLTQADITEGRYPASPLHSERGRCSGFAG